MQVRPGRIVKSRIRRYQDGMWSSHVEPLAGEEPLEIRIVAGGTRHTLTVTMRTPGDDFVLVAGLLLAEGVVHSREDIASIRYCVDRSEEQHYNIVNVDLRPGYMPDLAGLGRQLVTTSACGVCGKQSIDALRIRGCAPLPDGPPIEPTLLTSLPAKLRKAQDIFDTTGGLHAAALFSHNGELLSLREDVGRHNALDKLFGWALLERVPLHTGIVLVSGRAGFELAQKCVVAGAPVLCAISAPSSLAVATARDFGLTLVGFLRGERFNVYSGAERVAGATKC